MSIWRRTLDLLLGRRPVLMQVGAVCRDPASGNVLLITSRDTGRWVIPKGWPMEGRSLASAAMQEAWEEGGVQGVVDPVETGRYSYGKVQDSGFSIPVEVRVFTVWVDRLADDFPESGQRRRRWFTPAKAAALVGEKGLKKLLRDLPEMPA